MNKFFILLGLFLMVFTFVAANEKDLNFQREFLEGIDLSQINCEMILPFKSEIVGQEIPPQIPYSEETFDIYISGVFFGMVQIKDSKIINLDCEPSENRTYNVRIKNYQTIFDFTETEKPMEMLNDKLDSKEIQIEGTTMGKKIKMFFTKISLKIANWFI